MANPISSTLALPDFMEIYLRGKPTLLAARREKLAKINRDIVTSTAGTIKSLSMSHNSKGDLINYGRASDAMRMARSIASDHQMLSQPGVSGVPIDIISTLAARHKIAAARVDAAILFGTNSSKKSDGIGVGQGVKAYPASAAMMLVPDFTLIDQYYSSKENLYTTYVKLGSTVYEVTSRFDRLDLFRPMNTSGDAIVNWVNGTRNGTATPDALQNYKNTAVQLYSYERVK